MIKWGDLIDKHVRGETPIGTTWIRVDREGLVTGVYAIFGRTKKLVPSDGERWSVDDAKAVAEIELETELAFRAEHPEFSPKKVY